jgi:hypothetical protein
MSFGPPTNTLGLLALVNTTESGHEALRRQEIGPSQSRDIAVLCTRVHSVAEIGARLNLPLAVVRVLVGELQRASLVRVLAPQSPKRPSADLLARVLQGLVPS